MTGLMARSMAAIPRSRDSQHFDYGARGGVLVHSDGVTFSQELGETVALVKAPGAEGLSIENATGISTDWRGYTVKTQLSPYDENRVALNSDYFSKANIELENTVINPGTNARCGGESRICHPCRLSRAI